MTTPHLLATLYSLPNGRKSLVQIKNVGSEDMLWFKENRIRLSMEQLRDGEFVVYGRWPEQEEEDEELDPWEQPDAAVNSNGRKLLQLWNGHQLRTTPCSNEGAVIEFFFVPFIVEDVEEAELAADVNSSNTNPPDLTASDEEL